ncbi:MAG: hypothetical protein K2X27_24205, partial [Candidatus Obscuribacterales bacterium]|nr:hypothetical protein [Candidatus Obscuribacterales bacterium]
MEFKQDPEIDGFDLLKVDKELSFDAKKESDGSITLQNMEGFTAESDTAFGRKSAKILETKISKTESGETEVRGEARAKLGKFNIKRVNISTKPAEVYEQVKTLFDDITDYNQKNQPKSPLPKLSIE